MFIVIISLGYQNWLISCFSGQPDTLTTLKTRKTINKISEIDIMLN